MFLFLCGCDIFIYQQPSHYEGSIWVCKDPAITFYVSDSDDSELPTSTEDSIKNIQNQCDYAILETKDQTVYLSFNFHGRMLFVAQLDEWGKEKEGEVLYGTCRYSKDQFTVTVDKETDQLFNGQYETLVFKRMETRVETSGDKGTVLLSPIFWRFYERS